MTRNVVIAALAMAAIGFNVAPVNGQDSLLAELYGQGVHAYFAGNYQQAHEHLTRAINLGSLDPRCFYFRGLSYARLGRPQQAKNDLQKGAELEARGGARVFPVGRSLQRIQGRQRMALEQYRQAARLAARMQEYEATQARYEEMQRAEEQVLRDPNRRPPADARELVGDPPPQPVDPFSGEEEKPVPAPPRPQPAEVAAEPAPAPAAESAAATPAAPAAEAPAATPSADPFGGDAPSAEPFGGDAPSSDPLGGDTPSSDPFGGDTPSSDPFGGDTPADDDPFGGGDQPSDDPFGGDTPDDPFQDDQPAGGDSSSGDDPFANPFGN